MLPWIYSPNPPGYLDTCLDRESLKRFIRYCYWVGVDRKYTHVFIMIFCGGCFEEVVFVEEKLMVPMLPKGLGEGIYCDVT